VGGEGGKGGGGGSFSDKCPKQMHPSIEYTLNANAKCPECTGNLYHLLAKPSNGYLNI